MQYIGKLDRSKLGKYKDKIVTDEVVLTLERKIHIYEDHTNDYKRIISNICRITLNPSEVIEDIKNASTVFLIGNLETENLIVIVKLNTNNDKKHPKNSVKFCNDSLDNKR